MGSVLSKASFDSLFHWISSSHNMKVFIALVLAIGSVSARGSGPYLPSGWKPQGPAFYLPSEAAKSVFSPVQESLLQETEASGSDAFREYGPPKLEEVFLNGNQALPDIDTEQSFSVVAKNVEVVAAVEEAANVETNTEQVAAIVEEVSTATESQVAEKVEAIEEQATELSDVQPTAGAQVFDVLEQEVEAVESVQSGEDNVEVVPTVASVEDLVVPTAIVVEEIVVPTAAIEEVVVPLAEQELVQEAVPTPVSDVLVDTVAVGVNNIAGALVNLEQEAKAVEVLSIGNVAEITSIQETSGSLEQVPEGFLEYGPPGFLEYGPPKQEDLARLAVEVANAAALENNEVRKRRFSPRFRSTRKH